MIRMENKKIASYAFIDASNLFYGGEKSLGWKIDYENLFEYLTEKYSVRKVFYFGGAEIHKFNFDYLKNDTVPIAELKKYLKNEIKTGGSKLNEADLILLSRHLQRVKFYSKLESFGYELRLKPVKLYYHDSSTVKKANCDVDMAFY